MPGPRRVRTHVPALLLALAVAAGCGSATSDGASSAASSEPTADTPTASAPPTPEPTPAVEAPECAEVWRAGATLPRVYRGCLEDGALVAVDALGCSSGQRLLRHADRFYGVAGGTVQETSGPLEQDPDYVADVRSCRG